MTTLSEAMGLFTPASEQARALDQARMQQLMLASRQASTPLGRGLGGLAAAVLGLFSDSEESKLKAYEEGVASDKVRALAPPVTPFTDEAEMELRGAANLAAKKEKEAADIMINKAREMQVPLEPYQAAPGLFGQLSPATQRAISLNQAMQGLSLDSRDSYLKAAQNLMNKGFGREAMALASMAPEATETTLAAVEEPWINPTTGVQIGVKQLVDGKWEHKAFPRTEPLATATASTGEKEGTKFYYQQLGNISDAASAAVGIQNNAETMLAEMSDPNLRMGMLADVKTFVAKVGDAFGLDTSTIQSIQSAGTFDKASKSLVTELMKVQKGVVSDADRAMFEKIAGTITDRRESVIFMTKFTRDMARRAQEREQLWASAGDDKKGSPERLVIEWNKRNRDLPLIKRVRGTPVFYYDAKANFQGTPEEFDKRWGATK